MPKHNKGGASGEEGSISLGTEAWNVADGYTKLKILRNLVLLDKYDTISQFGAEDMDIDLMLEDNVLAKRRVEALNRFASTLRILIGNVKFALKKDDHDLIAFYLERLENVKKFLPYVAEENENAVTHEVEVNLNMDLFGTCLDKLQKIKEDLNFPINNAELIFRGKEETDIDKLMQDIIEGG